MIIIKKYTTSPWSKDKFDGSEINSFPQAWFGLVCCGKIASE